MKPSKFFLKQVLILVSSRKLVKTWMITTPRMTKKSCQKWIFMRQPRTGDLWLTDTATLKFLMTFTLYWKSKSIKFGNYQQVWFTSPWMNCRRDWIAMSAKRTDSGISKRLECCSCMIEGSLPSTGDTVMIGLTSKRRIMRGERLAKMAGKKRSWLRLRRTRNAE